MKYFIALLFFILCLNFSAQEGLRSLTGNPSLFYQNLNPNLPFGSSAPQLRKAASLSLPFKEDFSNAAYQSYPNQLLWSDSSVYVNTGYPIAPMSIGVATFDGLNKFGYPYTPNLFNLSQSLPADTLTSREINAFSAGSATLQPSDSIALSFYYQARGRGEAPELTDSLILDFYKPKQQSWTSRIWFAKGNSNSNTNDTIFKRGFVFLDSSYLHDGFKFRFRNKATTAGNFDHWHLDYIYLDKNRSIKADTTYDDIAFGYTPSTFLARYYSMPWQQYDASEKATQNSVFIRNNNNNAANMLNMSYEYQMFDQLGTPVHSYAGNANPDLKSFKYFGWSNFSNHSNPPFSGLFPALTDSTDYTIKHRIFRSGTNNDFFPGNDTTIQYQRFRNYYAYDDGTAEGGYYILGTGGQMAIKIKVNVADTLRAVRIYFDPAGSMAAAQSYNFRLKIWSATLTGPGFPLYTDSTMQPKYFAGPGFKASPEYTLTSPLLLSPGEYFIGFQQFVASGITVGFDKNNDRRSYLYFDSGNGWTQSGVYGALMLRPVFGAKIEPPVGLKEIYNRDDRFLVFPNPANAEIQIITNEKKSNYTLINISGQNIKSGIFENETSINTSELVNGIYFLMLQSEGTAISSKKIIVQH
jgi:hypothetical protein